MAIFIIAEAGVNHNGSKSKALELIEVAAKAGADAIKFQTFNAERLATKNISKANYQNKTTSRSESQLDMLKRLELPVDWHYELKQRATELGIEFLSTAFDTESLNFLESLDLPFYKIPSGEITNGPLLLEFAKTGKKTILSTGMSTLGEVEQALAILSWGYKYQEAPNKLSDIWRHWSSKEATAIIKEKVSLLHCTSEYPAAMEEVNLKAMDMLSNSFSLPVGYSDHTEGSLISIAAAARGAVIIEKHFTLDRELPGPDHKASINPTELNQLVASIRNIEIALGDGQKRPQPSELENRSKTRQTIIAKSNISNGEIFTDQNLTTARAGAGEYPVQIWDKFKTRSNRKYNKGDIIES
ncbi:N-acetylneuraminate synthase [Terasakiispira papahanaumokuakeensis]|uniref:N-acetylneuraminate synthase n=1 Tax=Terasakiispira papahanaumokuakeensis TaxID=197479 RepID=A0A1E2VBC9_9GAMM|nr:N-acetylneuraminate synthase [Terasakiispira papahanaumokuakeensis]ODC04162.1 N-acetylneuraminate synthase [Terasakiispira papahanaumokuakeensis]